MESVEGRGIQTSPGQTKIGNMLLNFQMSSWLLTLFSACLRPLLNVNNMIKSDWRSTLGSEDINTLMTVSPDIKNFRPQTAIDLWTTSGRRQHRPTFMDGKEQYGEEEDENIVCVALAEVPNEADIQDEGETLTEAEIQDENKPI